MANDRVRLIRVIPGSYGLRAAIQEFARIPDGYVTSLDDRQMVPIAQVLGEGAPVEVVAFGALVTKVLRLAGLETRLLPNDDLLRAAIGSACGQLSESSPFAKAGRHKGAHSVIADALHQLSAWGLQPDDLDDIATQVSRRCAAKLSSLADIGRCAHEMLGLLGRETMGSMLRRLENDVAIELEGDFERILVVLGDDESPTKLAFLGWLASQGCEITLVGERHPTSSAIFESVGRVAEYFGVTPIDLGEGNRLQNRLFGDPTAEGAPVNVERRRHADALAECEWAVRESDPARTAIFVRDLDGYAPLLESAGRRLGVPIRVSRRTALRTNAFTRMTLAALDFCASDDVRTIIPILSSSYLQLDAAGRKLVQSAVFEARRMRGTQWTHLGDWAQAHQAEYPWLAFLVDWRNRATAQTRGLRDWIALLTELMTSADAPWTQAVVGGDGEMLTRDLYARNRIEITVNQHASIDRLGMDRELTLSGFRRWVIALIDQADVAIPPRDTGVLVTNNPAALSGCPHIIALGLLEGVFPRRRSEHPILEDRDLAEISALRPHLPAMPDSRSRARREREEFYRVCCAASERLVLTYPAAGDDRDNVPAFYLKMVADQLGLGGGPVEVPRTRLFPDPPQRPADVRLAEAFASPPESLAAPKIETEATHARLRRDPATDGVTVDELRDALRCPFQHFARYRLRLHTGRSIERWYEIRRLPLLANLAAPGSPDEVKARLTEALESRLEEMYPELPDWEMRLLESGGERVIKELVEREFLARERWAKDKGSVRLNVRFGSPTLRDDVAKEVKLVGTLPAQSQLGPYRVAHLYGSAPTETKMLNEDHQIRIGAYLLAQFTPNGETAVEIDTPSGERLLFVLHRIGNLTNESTKLKVIDLSEFPERNDAYKAYFTEVKSLLKKASGVIESGSIEPRPGDHCDRCSFGELCRRSRDFGEDDSPFGEDGDGE